MSDTFQEETRYCWEIVNLATNETCKYWGMNSQKVTAEHALTSPSVKDWANGDPVAARVPHWGKTEKPDTAKNWDVVNMGDDSVINAGFDQPVPASRALEDPALKQWANGQSLRVRPASYTGMLDIRVTSSEGVLLVCRRSGLVRASVISKPESYLNHVIWVDLDDFFRAFPHRNRATTEEIDILHLAYASLREGSEITICECCFHFRAEKEDFDPSYFKA